MFENSRNQGLKIWLLRFSLFFERALKSESKTAKPGRSNAKVEFQAWNIFYIFSAKSDVVCTAPAMFCCFSRFWWKFRLSGKVKPLHCFKFYSIRNLYHKTFELYLISLQFTAPFQILEVHDCCNIYDGKFCDNS